MICTVLIGTLESNDGIGMCYLSEISTTGLSWRTAGCGWDGDFGGVMSQR
jgi:hypothetical protein